MIWISLLFFATTVSGKIYDRCELARELKSIHEAPLEQIPTWVCIAQHESNYNTSAVGHLNADGSGDHGIFQISDLYWCSPPGNGWACGVTCNQLKDDDLEDDFICARRIFREHKRLSGDGFNAWVVYRSFCQGSQVEKYIEGCFDYQDEKKDEKEGDKKEEDKEVEKNKVDGKKEKETKHQPKANCIICPKKDTKPILEQRGFFFNGFKWLK